MEDNNITDAVKNINKQPDLDNSNYDKQTLQQRQRHLKLPDGSLDTRAVFQFHVHNDDYPNSHRARALTQCYTSYHDSLSKDIDEIIPNRTNMQQLGKTQASKIGPQPNQTIWTSREAQLHGRKIKPPERGT